MWYHFSIMKKPGIAFKYLMLAGMVGACVVSAGSLGLAEQDNIRRVIQVVDGNTLLVEGGLSVRLAGVSVPKLGEGQRNLDLAKAKRLDLNADLDAEALENKKFVEYLVLDRKVRLEADPGFERLNHRDQDGSIFAYVWFTAPIFQKPPDWMVIDPKIQGGRHEAFLNACMVRSGFGAMDIRYPFQYADRFLSLEEEARQAQRGIWRHLEETQETDSNIAPA